MIAAWGWAGFRTLALVGMNNVGAIGVRLYKSMSGVATPADNAVLAESQWPGYHGITLPAYAETDLPGTPQIQFVFPEVTWTVGTLVTAENIVGWGVWFGTGLVYLVELSTPIAVNVTGQVVGLQVTFDATGQ